jgi:hypothetical protein
MGNELTCVATEKMEWREVIKRRRKRLVFGILLLISLYAVISFAKARPSFAFIYPFAIRSPTESEPGTSESL